VWVIAGKNRGSILQAKCVTRPGGARREWLPACLALVGAAVGWLVPLLAKGVVAGASSALYAHAEGVLCPLLACFGGGIGFTCGVMATTALLPPRAESREPSLER
jgi:hypothetical protein